MSEELLDVALIKISGGTQSRVGINQAVVEEYNEALQNGAIFPPLDVYYDGKEYWLADGFHRYWATSKASLRAIKALIHQGTRRDAILHSVGANSAHGLRRTNADKHRAVEVLLRDEEWRQWSDREIARRCGVSNDFVSKIRKTLSPPSLSSDDSEKRTYTTKHGTSATMQVRNIGKTTADIPSLDAELAKSKREQHEKGRGDFLVTASNGNGTNGAIAIDVEAALPEILLDYEGDWTSKEYMPSSSNDENEGEVESYMPYTLYAASSCEEIDYLIDKLGAKEVAKQFVEGEPELKAEVRGYYPGIDAIVRAELGEHLNHAEAIAPAPSPETDQSPQPTDYEQEWLSAVAEVIRLRKELEQANELLGRAETRIIELSEQLTQTRKKLDDCRESDRSTLVGCRVKVINESSKHSSRLGTALSATVKQHKTTEEIEIVYSVQLDDAEMKNSFLEEELRRVEGE